MPPRTPAAALPLASSLGGNELPHTPYWDYLRRRRSLNPPRFDHYHPWLGFLLRQEQQQPRDTTPPVVTIQQPTPGLATRLDVTAIGLATDDLSGVKKVEARLDGGAIFSVTFDASGRFQFPAGLPLDGTADGKHAIRVRATDGAGNTSEFTTVRFTLDTRPPRITLALAPGSDTAPKGDGMTTLATVTLVGRTVPGLTVSFPSLGRTTVADSTGHFALPDVPLVVGMNPFTAETSRPGGRVGRAQVTVERCGFPDDLAGWRADEDGGTDPGSGSVTVASGAAVLLEGNSFDVTLAGSFVVPANPTTIAFEYAALAFDTADPGSINDAFEAALVDPNGVSLVPTFTAGRDAFFNVTEGQSVVTGSGVTIAGQRATLDISQIIPGTTATLVFRLVNNDQDTTTSVRIACATFPAGSVLVPLTTTTRIATPAVGAIAPAVVGATVSTVGTSGPDSTASISVAAAAGPPTQTPSGDRLLDPDGRVTFTTSADFDLGTYFNTNSTAIPDELQLQPRGEAQTFPFIWVSNSDEGTVSRFDTRTGKEIGRYRTGPSGGAHSPSRTAVASDGSVWVANRAFGIQADAVHVLLEGFIDRNGNGVLDTSRDLNADGFIQANEMLPWDANNDGKPDDERIAVSISVGRNRSTLAPQSDGVARAIAIDANDDVWVGLFNFRQYEVYDHNTGALKAIVPVTGQPYGAVVDADGFLWGATRSSFFDRVDTKTLQATTVSHGGGDNYGITLDNKGVVWTATNGSRQLIRYDPATDRLDSYGIPGNGRGVGAAADGTIWVATNNPDRLVRYNFAADGRTLLGTVAVPVGSVASAAVIDADGFVWTTTYGDNKAWKIDPATNTVAPGWPIATGRTPYNYSDMTGQVRLTVTQRTGTWTEVLDGERAGAAWAGVNLTALVPNLTSTRTRVRASNNRSDLTNKPWVETPSGAVLPKLVGRYLQVEIGMTAGNTEETPHVEDVTIVAVPLPSVAVDRTDGSEEQAGSTIVLTGRALARTPLVSPGNRVLNEIVLVTVNGVPVEALDPTGRFFTRITVAPGRNDLNVVATDRFGQTVATMVGLVGIDRPARAVDFTNLSDITASFDVVYARTSFAERTEVLYADTAVRNIGQYPVDAPLYVGVTNISDPTVRVLDAAGVTPEGVPYYDFTGLVTGGRLAPSTQTGTLSLAFLDPNRHQFTYDLVFFGLLNRAPSFTTIPTIEAHVGRAYAYDAEATDADRDPLAFSLVSGPTGLRIDAAAGELTWDPATTDLGTHSVVIRVDDSRGGFAEQHYTLTVTEPPPNRPPLFASVPNVSANVNASYTYQAAVTDPDGDPLTFAIATGPAGLAIDSRTGLVTWAPTAQQVGPQNVTLTATDGRGGTATQAYSILVGMEPGNHPPAIISDPATTAVVDQIYTYDIDAIDPDPTDTLTYSLVARPEGMTIDSRTGIVTWPVDFDDANQSFPVTVRVDDGRGGFDTQSYTITVSEVAIGEIRGTKFNDLDGDGLRGGNHLLVSSIGTDEVLRYDTRTGSFIDVFGSGNSLQSPEGLTIGPDCNLYVLSTREDGSGSVLRFDGRTGAFLDVFASGNGLVKPHGLAFGPDGHLYVANRNPDPGGHSRDGSVLRFDGRTGAFLGVFAEGGELDIPLDLVAGPDGYLYVTSQFSSSVLRYDVQTGSLVDVFVSEGSGGLFQPHALEFGPDGNLYVASVGGNAGILRYDGRTGAFLDTFISPGSGGLVSPTDVSFGDDGYVYVNSYNDDRVLRYDAVTGAFVDVLIPSGHGGLDKPDYSILAPSEPGLPGWVIYLDENRNGRRDPGDRWTTTDACGNYAFTGLEPGTYYVAEEPRPGWEQTAPEGGTHTIVVGAGEVITGIDFGNRESTEPPPAQPNRPPDITSTAPTTAAAGQLLRYDARAVDPDFDPLTFELVVKPEGMTVHPTLGSVVWFPTAEQVGAHDVTLRVQDGRGGFDLQVFTVTASRPNTNPVISSRPKGPAIVGVPYPYQVTAQDADGDTLAFRLDEGPVGMVIDPVTGLLTWTPAANQVATHHVAISVIDGRSGGTTQHFDLPAVATAPNDPPTITSQPRGSIRVGATYRYDVLASDPNNDALTYSLPAKPVGMTIDAAGHVLWMPTIDQLGSQTVQVRVDDGRGGFATQTFNLQVLNQVTNQPPSILSTPPQSATAGVLYAYDPRGQDRDNDLLAWALEMSPAGMSIDSATGAVRWTPAADQVGTQRVVVRAFDPLGGFATQTFDIAVRAVNLPPNIASVAVTTASVGRTYIYAVRANDIENDPLTFVLATAPAGMTIDPTTGVIQWTPAAGQVGSQNVALRVADNQGGAATQNYTVVVSAATPNRSPVITSSPAFVATAGQAYTYQAAANDPDGDPLNFLLLANPAAMTIDAASGLVTWTPTAAQLGPQVVTVAAVDPDGLGGTQTFTITVIENNQGPTITSQPVQNVLAGTPYRYDVQAGDPDGDPLSFRIDQGPAGLMVDGLGRVTWSPTAANAGVHRVKVTVADNKGASITQEYDLAVNIDAQTPRVNLAISSNPAQPNAPVTFVVTATDNVGVTGLGLTIDGQPVALDSQGRAVLSRPFGQYAIVAGASDAAGNTGLASTNWLVLAPPSSPPTVALTSPTDGQVISSPIDVIGTVTDDNLVGYALLVAPVGGGPFVEMFRGSDTVTDGKLGRFDPTGLANDDYIVRLEATDLSGTTVSIDTLVSVIGDLKVGNFTVSFTDLSIPVSGIPLSVTRTYDSLTAGRNGALGFGWRLEFRDTNLRTSVPDPTEDELELGLGISPYRDKTHVYITLPGGRREGFTFQPVPAPGFAGTFFGLRVPAFVPDRGVTSALTAASATLVQGPDGAYYEANGLPYNPADALNFGGTFTLTTQDGLAYVIDALTGLLNSVTDVNGNTLTFTDTEIRSSAGPMVVFERDPQGRITAAVDPAGKKVRYQYDVQGDLVAVIDRDNNTTQFQYQAPGRPHFLTEIIDPLGRTGVRNEYDAQGRLVKLFDADGKAVQLTHDPDHFLETVLDPLGNPTTFEYDLFGNVTREIDALGHETARTYDGNNNMLSETDPLGNTTTYTYDGNNNLLTTTDPLGNVTRNTYQTTVPGFFAQIQGARPVSYLAGTTDPLGNTTTYTYDGGNLTSTTDALGKTTKYTYDAAGNQTAITDADGKRTDFEYDGRGNLTKQTDALGAVTTYVYDANGNQLSQSTTVSGRVVTTTTEYDASGRPTKVTDAEGHVTRTEYDALGRQSATIDALGRRTEFVHDDRGQLIETRFADGTKSTTSYDAGGRRIASTDRAGRTTKFVYDAVGRLIETIAPDATPAVDADNPRTKTEYDAAGRVTAQIDELGHRTEFVYDAAGRRTQVKDALGHVTTTSYDTAGRRIAVTDALNNTTQFAYDALGRLTQTTFADAATTKSNYDALGRAIAQTDQLGRATHYEYDALGRLTAVVDALNQRTEYTYDEAGNLITQKDANGHETQYEYDRLGRRTATILPLGQRSDTAYDAVGNVAGATDFNRDTITYQYDVNNRLTRKQFPDGTAVTFTYTATGQRAGESDPRRATGANTTGTSTFTYDARDRLLSRNDPDGRTIAYTYDLTGNRTSVIIPSGTTSYTFDALNRLKTVTDPESGVTTYTYNARGELTRTDFPNGTFETRQYDPVGHLTVLENRGPSGVISSYTYTLAPNGRRDAVLEDNGRSVDYKYDLLDRLIEEFMDEAASAIDRKIRYTYDPVGNRLTRDDTAEGITTYSYDANDRLLTETLGGVTTPYTYDANGNTLSKFTSAVDRALYDWDFENRLIGATVADSTGTKDLVYKYNADGIRVASVVAGAETRFLIDSNQPYAQVLEEYTPGGVIVASYVYGNDLISQNRGGALSFYHVDGLGSTRALTNASGVVTDRYVYDAFGRTIGQFGVTGNVYLFTGEQRDSSVGLDYLRARYYDLLVGRFIGTDPFESSPSQPMMRHRFVFAGADPVNRVDPTGRFFIYLQTAVALALYPNFIQPYSARSAVFHRWWLGDCRADDDPLTRQRRLSIINNTPATFVVGENPSAVSYPHPIYALESLEEVTSNSSTIEMEAQRQQLNADFVKAIVWLESTHGWYDRFHESPSTLRPMNVNVACWKDLGANRQTLADPRKNIEIGTLILGRIWSRTPNPTYEKVATLYNFLRATKVTDYGKTVAYYASSRPWEN